MDDGGCECGTASVGSSLSAARALFRPKRSVTDRPWTVEIGGGGWWRDSRSVVLRHRAAVGQEKGWLNRKHTCGAIAGAMFSLSTNTRIVDSTLACGVARASGREGGSVAEGGWRSTRLGAAHLFAIVGG